MGGSLYSPGLLGRALDLAWLLVLQALATAPPTQNGSVTGVWRDGAAKHEGSASQHGVSTGFLQEAFAGTVAVGGRNGQVQLISNGTSHFPWGVHTQADDNWWWMHHGNDAGTGFIAIADGTENHPLRTLVVDVNLNQKVTLTWAWVGLLRSAVQCALGGQPHALRIACTPSFFLVRARLGALVDAAPSDIRDDGLMPWPHSFRLQANWSAIGIDDGQVSSDMVRSGIYHDDAEVKTALGAASAVLVVPAVGPAGFVWKLRNQIYCLLFLHPHFSAPPRPAHAVFMYSASCPCVLDAD